MNRLAFLFFLMPVSLFAQIIDVPDLELKRILTQTTVVYGDLGGTDPIGDVDANDDGEIDVQEARSVVHMVLRDGNTVNDLSGLEHFVNIQSLWMKDFEVPEFNTNSFSVLKQLEIEQFSLPKLEISNLDSLKAVVIRTIEIDSLVVENNSELLILEILTSGIIKDIYLSDLPKLESVEAGYNGIQSIRFQHTPMLSSLNLKNNLLEELDCSDLPNLVAVRCDDNPSLQELNIKNDAHELRDAVGIRNNIGLERICVDGFQKMEIESLVSELGLSAEVLNDCVVGNIEISKNHPLFYPNPTTNFIHFTESITKIELYNQLGVLVKQIYRPNSPINVSELLTGVYVLRFFDEKETSTTFFEKI